MYMRQEFMLRRLSARGSVQVQRGGEGAHKTHTKAWNGAQLVAREELEYGGGKPVDPGGEEASVSMSEASKLESAPGRTERP